MPESNTETARPGALKQALLKGGLGLLYAVVAVSTERKSQPEPEAEPAPPPFSWRRMLQGVLAGIKENNLPFLAAGLAYYGILAIVPGLIAAVSMYGLVADPTDAARLVDDLAGAVPAEVQSFIDGQISSIIEAPASNLSLSFAASVLGALWAASNGTKALIRGVNLAYGIDETRGLLKLRLLSILLTVGLIASVGAILTLVTFGHRWLGGSRWFNPILEYGRWPIQLLAVIVLLGAFYRLAPARRRPGWTVASMGAVVAALTWLVASAGLGFYVSHFGSYNETYGTLGAIIVLLLWLFISAFIVLVGAVLDRTLYEIRRASAPS